MTLNSDHYWLTNAHVPISLLVTDEPEILGQQTKDNLVLVDIEIIDGVIANIKGSATRHSEKYPALNLRGGQVWCCFVDMHTHLDKGHIWERNPNPDGTFIKAIETVQIDRQYWQTEDVYRRMEFGLKCSYAHGTKAIRTHIDAFGEQGKISFDVFKQLQNEWNNRLILQAVSLVSLDYFITEAGKKLADLVAEVGGILGGVAYMNPDLEAQLDKVFTLAKERNLSLDFHTDESGNPEDMTLRYVAEAAIRNEFNNQIICGHCCSLAVQSIEEVTKTLDLVKQANIGIVSLPMCNLYLQDRTTNKTPRWRGVTLLHEIKNHNIPIAVASDNCRDPFYGFGDHDMLEVFKMSTKIAHLDRPYKDWNSTITVTPADLMGLPKIGRIAVGMAADLIIFKGRHFSELLSRSQHDRIVLRNGKAINTTLPDYSELDDLIQNSEYALLT